MSDPRTVNRVAEEYEARIAAIHATHALALSRARDEARREAEQSKDAAYAERDRLVAALSKLFPSCLARHPDSDLTWDDAWRWIVFIQLPTGQASWHIHESELPMFAHLARSDSNPWDGHTTEEKYARLNALELCHVMQEARREALEEAAKVCDARRAEWARLHPETGGERVHAFDAGVLSASNTCAERIRALIPNTPQGETKPQASPAVKALVEAARPLTEIVMKQCSGYTSGPGFDAAQLARVAIEALAAVEREIGAQS